MRASACVRRRSGLAFAVIAVIAVVALVAAADVLADVVTATGVANAGDAAGLAAPKSLNQVIGNVRTWLFGLLVSLATLFMTVGAIRYLLAGGDPGQVAKAKETLKNAAYGYGLAVLAPLLVTILKGLVGG
jgi:hypothetical protein